MMLIATTAQIPPMIPAVVPSTMLKIRATVPERTSATKMRVKRSNT